MPDFYEVMDINEIDGQGSDVSISAEKGDVGWTKVLSHLAQELPEGNYDFSLSFQVSLSATNNSILYRTVGSVSLGAEEIKIDRNSPLARHTYFFNLSWEGGLFNLDIEMARDGTSFTAIADFAEFSVKRRS